MLLSVEIYFAIVSEVKVVIFDINLCIKNLINEVASDYFNVLVAVIQVIKTIYLTCDRI